MAIDISKGIEEHLSKIREIRVENLRVPPFYVAGWPEEISLISVRIRRPCLYMNVRKVSDKLFRLRRWFCIGFYGYKFFILRGGYIAIESADGTYYSSDIKNSVDTDDGQRANALLLFNQLKNRALPKIVKKVEKDARHNQEVIEAVRKALEPFLPQIVADELAK